MKYISILSLLMLCFAVSCESLIEPKVYSILTDANAFQSKDDAIAAVNAAYSRLKQPSGSNDSWMYYAGFQVTITDLTTDAGHAKSGGDVGLMSDANWGPSNTYLAYAWQHQYKLVSDVNNALYYIPKIEALSDAEEKQFLGELKFLRSLGYYDLTNAFGAVPLMTEDEVAKNIQSPDYEARVEVTEVSQINAQIIADLEYAAANLPLNYASSPIYTSNDVGRATKGSALALLAKLYLREKEWQKVVDVTKQIMDLKQYELYPSYAKLFAESNKWCSENIFSALSNNLVDATEMMNHFGPINHKEVTDRWQYFAIPWRFWNTFEKNDDRREMFFYDYIGTDGLRYVQPPAGSVNPPAGYYYLPDVASKKYADPEGSTTYLDGHVFPIIRYADILMSRAEALNELNGPNAESIQLVNQVKARSKATLLGAAGTFTKDGLRDAILTERGWEFFFECKRREDLIRMGKYQSMVNTYLTAIGQPARIDINKHKYFPYPQAQVDLNPNLSNSGRQ
ncbi:RagB/SusD family nutrient uptake outer membrane protein [Dyadobacter bucti]|uniref:RagB/SusD family nutrient uptake outer membrane protein n=1 Tax=Dyadobacter bucti TaxID=2572203 RepID=UPI0011089438|nr:RagB/SusD family nutrient uptake outer membrane protein [Dyadobacter bucti]